MKPRSIKTIFVALTVATLFTASARAYNTGDFVIGFHQSGNATDIAGSVTLANFTTVQTFDLGNINSSFSTVFNNPNWFTDSTILWGLAATNDTTNASTNINWITSPSTVLTGKTATQTGTIQSRINASGNGTQAPFTTNPIGSGIVGTQDLGSNAQAWQRYMTGGSISGGADWGFYGANGTQANFGNGVSGTTLNVYQLPIGPGLAGTDIGDFNLAFNSNSGDMMLTFTPQQAIPEPSTYALMSVGAILLLLVYFQRRRAARASIPWSF